MIYVFMKCRDRKAELIRITVYGFNNHIEEKKSFENMNVNFEFSVKTGSLLKYVQCFKLCLNVSYLRQGKSLR